MTGEITAVAITSSTNDELGPYADTYTLTSVLTATATETGGATVTDATYTWYVTNNEASAALTDADEIIGAIDGDSDKAAGWVKIGTGSTLDIAVIIAAVKEADEGTGITYKDTLVVIAINDATTEADTTNGVAADAVTVEADPEV